MIDAGLGRPSIIYNSFPPSDCQLQIHIYIYIYLQIASSVPLVCPVTLGYLKLHLYFCTGERRSHLTVSLTAFRENPREREKREHGADEFVITGEGETAGRNAVARASFMSTGDGGRPEAGERDVFLFGRQKRHVGHQIELNCGPRTVPGTVQGSPGDECHLEDDEETGQLEGSPAFDTIGSAPRGVYFQIDVRPDNP